VEEWGEERAGELQNAVGRSLRDDLGENTAGVRERRVGTAVAAAACRGHQRGEELAVGRFAAVDVLPLPVDARFPAGEPQSPLAFVTVARPELC
jgi:hypothetical protein